ncbi:MULTISPECIES: hypothetical protein [unclassified Streptomyces]|uniref:hypothetical protein n=1 Tax=Streptomyces sp. NPDC127129 TaxID=3345373 RepID=UPI00363D6ED7
MDTTTAPETTAPATTDRAGTTDRTETTDPAPATPESSTALRLVALGGLLVLFLSLIATVVVVLEDTIGDDGTMGAASRAGFLTLGLGTLTGLVAAVAPRAVLAHGARKRVVVVQYALAVIAPVIALMD